MNDKLCLEKVIHEFFNNEEEFINRLKEKQLIPENVQIASLLPKLYERYAGYGFDNKTWRVFITKHILDMDINDIKRRLNDNIGDNVSRNVTKIKRSISKIKWRPSDLEKLTMSTLIHPTDTPYIQKLRNIDVSYFRFKYFEYKLMDDDTYGLRIRETKNQCERIRNQISEKYRFEFEDPDEFPWNMLKDLDFFRGFSRGTYDNYCEIYGVYNLFRNKKELIAFLNIIIEHVFNLTTDWDTFYQCHIRNIQNQHKHTFWKYISDRDKFPYVLYEIYRNHKSITELASSCGLSKTTIHMKIYHGLRKICYYTRPVNKQFFLRNMKGTISKIYDLKGSKYLKHGRIYIANMYIENKVLPYNEYGEIDDVSVTYHESCTPETDYINASHFVFLSSSTSIDDEITKIRMWDDE